MKKILFWIAFLIVAISALKSCSKKEEGVEKTSFPSSFTFTRQTKDSNKLDTALYEVTQVNKDTVKLTCTQKIGSTFFNHIFSCVITIDIPTLSGKIEVNDPKATPSLKTGTVILSKNNNGGYDMMSTYNHDGSKTRGVLTPN